MSEIKVNERPVVFDPDRMIVRQQAGGWLAFYRQTGGEYE